MYLRGINHKITQQIPIEKAIIAGVNLQVNPRASMDPVNANPIQVPRGAEITIIASHRDLELTGKYASTNRGP